MTDFLNREMAVKLTFEHTKNALSRLENQFKCSKCGIFADSPVTLGGCEHLFCNVCCVDYQGKCCPICDIPAHVKDAKIDRQLYNLARLCHKLSSVLHDSSSTIKIKEPTSEGTDGLKNHKNNDQISSNKTKKGRKNPLSNYDKGASPAQAIKEGTTDTVKPSRRSGQNKFNNDSSVCDSGYIKVDKAGDSAETISDADVKTSKLNGRGRAAKNSLGDGKQPKTDSETKKNKAGGRKTRSLEPRSRKALSNQNPLSSANDNTASSSNQNTVASSFGSSDQNDDDALGTGQKCSNSRKRKSVEKSVSGRKTRLRHSVGGHETDPSKSGVNSKLESSKLQAEPAQFTSLTTEGKKKDGVQTKRRKSNIVTSESKELKATKRRKSAGDALTNTSECTATFSPKSGGRRSLPKSLPKSSPAVAKSRGVPAIDKRNAKGETALQVASIKNDIEKVRSLLAEGANPNIRDNAGWSPLHEACNHGYLEVATLLLDSGAMVNVPGLDNDTALHDAVSNNKIECVKLLVSRGASLTLRNMSGHTAVDLAVTEAMKQALATPVSGSAVNMESQPLNVLEYQPPCLLGTGLSREEKVTLQKACRKLKVKQTDEVTPEVTHIVTRCNAEGMCPRTIKLLHGILLGKWIVPVEWLATCEQVGSLVCEEAFEVQGTSLSPNSQAPYKGRMNSRQQLPDLFNGCQFYFHGSFEYATPAKEDLVTLIKAGDGQIMVREPKPGHLQDLPLTVPYHVDPESDLADCGIFVVHENQVKFEPIRTKKMCSVPSSWIMDCVSYFKIMPLPPVSR